MYQVPGIIPGTWYHRYLVFDMCTGYQYFINIPSTLTPEQSGSAVGSEPLKLKGANPTVVLVW